MDNEIETKLTSVDEVTSAARKLREQGSTRVRVVAYEDREIFGVVEFDPSLTNGCNPFTKRGDLVAYLRKALDASRASAAFTHFAVVDVLGR